MVLSFDECGLYCPLNKRGNSFALFSEFFYPLVQFMTVLSVKTEQYY